MASSARRSSDTAPLIAEYARAKLLCTRPPFQDVVAPHTRRSVQATAIEPVVWAVVERVLHNPALIPQELERQQQGTSTQQSALAHERRLYEGPLARCDKELRKWEQAYLADAIDVQDLKARRAEVTARRTSLEHEMVRSDDQQRLLEQVVLDTASLAEYCQRVREALHRFTAEEKRLALYALNITVIWHHGNPLEIRESIPVDIASNAVRHTAGAA